MKVIDLLNKIANKEEVPKKIRVGNSAFELSLVELNGSKHYSGNTESVLNNVLGMGQLNDEVEIIEEPKEIEKIGSWYEVLEAESKKTQLEEINHNFNVIFDRLEVLIDVVNELKKEEK